MKSTPEPIVVYEHSILPLKKEDSLFAALQKYYGNGCPYFELIHKGVKFTEFVGVIQIGKQVIEVLPKADRNNESNPDVWRRMLIDMLRSVHKLQAASTSNSRLRLKSNHILDLYFEQFVIEVEKLLHAGLIKSYRQVESNLLALRGKLKFAQHINLNLIHQERFYVRHNTYDKVNVLHQVLYKTLIIIKRINTNKDLTSRIGNLLIQFPQMPDLKIDLNLFGKIRYNRKNNAYQKSIEIAKMIILKYHPDLSTGKNNVLALMFNMNVLWEEFILEILKKSPIFKYGISGQASKNFWQPSSGCLSRIKPDIWIKLPNGENVILDTKWKNLNGYNPSAEDLRQMFVYHEYFNAKKVALIYPGDSRYDSHGRFYMTSGIETGHKQCSVLLLSPEKDIKQWQKNIATSISRWINDDQEESL
jgi:5-methylcytosine-specific restriction enzyme subunit McrC